jgi:hypothetical protein
MATTQIVTINQILGYFEDFVNTHEQLKSFGYGPTSEVGVSKQMTFPYMWVSHQSDSYIRITNKTQIPELKFVLLFMDQVNIQSNYQNINGQDSNNGQEVISDTFQYLQDCITEMNTNWTSRGIMIAEDVRVYPAFDETPDKVNGWVGEVTLKLTHVNCSIPN